MSHQVTGGRTAALGHYLLLSGSGRNVRDSTHCGHCNRQTATQYLPRAAEPGRNALRPRARLSRRNPGWTYDRNFPPVSHRT